MFDVVVILIRLLLLVFAILLTVTGVNEIMQIR